MRIFSLLFVVTILHALIQPSLSLWRGPPPHSPPLTVEQAKNLSINQTAYVAIHTHTNTHRDRYWMDGILTMYGTLRDAISAAPVESAIDYSINNPINRPMIVLVTANTPHSVRQLYIDHNLKVIEIPDHTTDQSLCADRFNKIHLWNAEILPYEKVVFLDNDVLVVHSIDRLFACTDFCMVYSSIQHFTDSIFVVKPNQQVYESIKQSFSALPPIYQRNECAEESWHFFLYQFGDIEAAPLFDLSRSPDTLKSNKHHIQRLSSSWSLNALMYYEFYTWRLMRGKEFRNYTDTQGVPAFTLSFTGLKPYNFAPGIFFNLNWLWHKERDAQLKRDYTGFCVFWGCLTVATALYALFGVRATLAWCMRKRKSNETGASVLNAVRSAVICVFGYPPYDVDQEGSSRSVAVSQPSYFSLFYYWLPTIGATWTCLFVALLMININGWILYWTIDILTPPFLAWTTFCTMHGLMTIVNLQFLRYAFHFSPQKWRKLPINQSTVTNDESHSLLSTDRPTQGASQTFNYSTQLTTSPKLSLNFIDCMPMWFWEWFTFLSMRAKKYPEFVVKMFAIFPAVAAVLIAHVNIWRHLVNQAHQCIDTQGNKVAK